MSKYASARDEVLHALTMQGWECESSGDVQSPTGWFALIVNSASEVDAGNGVYGIVHDFAEDIASAELDDASELIGAFIVSEDNYGFVSVTRHDRESEAKGIYDALAAEYDAWSSDEDDA